MSFTTVRALTVMPAPAPLTAVVPVRKLPVNVTVSLVPRAPVFGAIEVRLPGGVVTVKVTALLVPPADAVTVTFLAPAEAPGLIVKVAVTEVSLCTAMLFTVIPPPDTFTAVVVVRPAPVRVTVTTVVWPGAGRAPNVGAMLVSAGPVTVNGNVLLAPLAVTTPTFTLPMAAEAVLVMVAVMVVADITTTLLTDTPVAAGVTTTVAPATKLVPVRVTFVAVPRAPEFG